MFNITKRYRVHVIDYSKVLIVSQVPLTHTGVHTESQTHTHTHTHTHMHSYLVCHVCRSANIRKTMPPKDQLDMLQPKTEHCF